MIFNVTGGGGTSLNFKVVGGTTQPTSPKENTIWVNTDVAIPSWAFSATEPGSPAAGMVWISTGTSSTAEFNALKKNDIQVYPSRRAKQYVGGQWVSVEAYIYKGGEWVQCCARETLLYSKGDACEEVTGGWESKNSGAGTISFDEAQITLNLRGRDNVDVYGGVVTKHPVDLTNMVTLTINEGWLGEKNGSDERTYPRFGVSRTTPDSANTARDLDAYISSGTDLDVSELSGEYYVFIGAAFYGSYQFWANISVKEVKAV